MRQPSTRDLLAYWNTLRGPRSAPDRADVDPGAIRSILPDVFLLGLDPAQRYPFRLAGMAVCGLFGRELRETAFTALWAPASESAILDMTQSVIDDHAGAIASVAGFNEGGQTLALEMLLLPLTCRDGTRARVIGSLCTPSLPYWSGIRPVLTLQLGEVSYVGRDVDDPGEFVAGSSKPTKGPGFVLYPATPR